jgi:hypothetical protein
LTSRQTTSAEALCITFNHPALDGSQSQAYALISSAFNAIQAQFMAHLHLPAALAGLSRSTEP